MPTVSVRAVYDQGEVRFLEKPPVQGRQEVLVTFLSPEPEAEITGDLRSFRDLKGIWSGIDLSLEDIQASEYRLPEDLL